VVPLIATDTIIVYATPPAPIINSTGPTVICEGENLDLIATDSTNNIQWYESGTLLVGANNTIYTPINSGNYSVIVTTPQGCTNSSSSTNVTINPIPTKPTFFINGNTFTTGVNGLTLQWFLNGNSIPGATSNTYTAQTGGTYVLCGTDSNGCTNCSDSLVFSGVGLNEHLDFSFSIFPNPSNGSFTIKPDFPENAGEYDLSVADLAGRVIYLEKTVTGTRDIHLPNITPGTYQIIFRQNGKQSISKLIVTRL
jgi:uncharacterized membrane protein